MFVPHLLAGLLLFSLSSNLIGCIELIRRSEGVNPETPHVSDTSDQPVDTTAGLEEQEVDEFGSDEGSDSGNLAEPGNVKRLRQSGREKTKQVNAYALWCIRNNMWEEARLHLEQGLEQDSSASSILNNLGIVYERLGRRAEAAAAYQKAGNLNLEKPAYSANLQRFEQSQEYTSPDSAGLNFNEADPLRFDSRDRRGRE